MVKTEASHAFNIGSNPVRVTRVMNVTVSMLQRSSLFLRGCVVAPDALACVLINEKHQLLLYVFRTVLILTCEQEEPKYNHAFHITFSEQKKSGRKELCNQYIIFH